LNKGGKNEPNPYYKNLACGIVVTYIPITFTWYAFKTWHILALIRPFKVLLMDEPTSALDPEGVSLVGEKLVTIRDDGCAVLLTTHDLNMVEALKGRRWRMEWGQLETD
jgi:alpha-D-ribose 1-methylphosphonate 5-triphosphate synthase subunit PhnL